MAQPATGIIEMEYKVFISGMAQNQCQ